MESPDLIKQLKLIVLDVSPGAIDVCVRILDQLLEPALALAEEHGIIMLTLRGVEVVTT